LFSTIFAFFLCSLHQYTPPVAEPQKWLCHARGGGRRRETAACGGLNFLAGERFSTNSILFLSSAASGDFALLRGGAGAALPKPSARTRF